MWSSGDRFGTSCTPLLADVVQGRLRSVGLSRRDENRPYAGGFITEHYGEPSAAIHALQIEINRALYMDEERLEPNDGFDRLRGDVTRVLDATFRTFSAEAPGWQQAAE